MWFNQTNINTPINIEPMIVFGNFLIFCFDAVIDLYRNVHLIIVEKDLNLLINVE